MTRYKGPWGHNLSSGEAGRRAVDSVTGIDVLDKYINKKNYAEGGFVDDPQYTVQGGDTLNKISQETGIPINTLIELNNIEDPNSLSVGQTLKLQPEQEPEEPEPQTTTNSQSSRQRPRVDSRPQNRSTFRSRPRSNYSEESPLGQESEGESQLARFIRNRTTPTGKTKAFDEYMSYIGGDTSDITEADFTDDQLNLLREVVNQARRDGKTKITESDYYRVGGGENLVTGSSFEGNDDFSPSDAEALYLTLGEASIEGDNVTDTYNFNWTPETALNLAKKSFGKGEILKAGMHLAEGAATPLARISRYGLTDDGFGYVGPVGEETDRISGETIKNIPGRNVNINLEDQNAMGGFVQYKRPTEYFLGGLVKKGLPIAGKIAGTAIGGPAGGAIGGALGGAVAGQIDNEDEMVTNSRARAQQHATPSITPQSTMGNFKYGGLTHSQTSLQENNKPTMTDMPRYRQGGLMPMSNNRPQAKQVQGPRHEQGGVPLDNNTEVEGGETMDNVRTSQGDGEFVFSDRIQVPETDMTFAQLHKVMVEKGATEDEIAQLAELQEQVKSQQGGQQGGQQRQQAMMAQQQQQGQRQQMGGGGKRNYAGGGMMKSARSALYNSLGQKKK